MKGLEMIISLQYVLCLTLWKLWNKKYDGSAGAHVGMTRLAMALQQQPQYYQGFFFGIAINAIFDSNVRGETQGFLVDEKI